MERGQWRNADCHPGWREDLQGNISRLSGDTGLWNQWRFYTTVRRKLFLTYQLLVLSHGSNIGIEKPVQRYAAEGYFKYSFATEYGCDVEVLNSVTSRHLYIISCQIMYAGLRRYKSVRVWHNSVKWLRLCPYALLLGGNPETIVQSLRQSEPPVLDMHVLLDKYRERLLYRIMRSCVKRRA